MILIRQCNNVLLCYEDCNTFIKTSIDEWQYINNYINNALWIYYVLTSFGDMIQIFFQVWWDLLINFIIISFVIAFLINYNSNNFPVSGETTPPIEKNNLIMLLCVILFQSDTETKCLGNINHIHKFSINRIRNIVHLSVYLVDSFMYSVR